MDAKNTKAITHTLTLEEDEETQGKIKEILEKFGAFMDGDCAVDVDNALDIDEAFAAIKKVLEDYRKPKEKPSFSLGFV